MGPQEVALGAGILLIVIWLAYRLYTSQSFTKEGFASAVSGESHSFVMYYADWCGHCTRTKPEFVKLGSTMTIGEKTVKIVAVNAEKDPDAVKGKEIRGFPTIHLYGPKGNLVQEYSGQRNKEAFEQFLNQHVN
jgi:thioredoxin-like negative regulator of GroEL